jgi:hypothetical protein
MAFGKFLLIMILIFIYGELRYDDGRRHGL